MTLDAFVKELTAVVQSHVTHPDTEIKLISIDNGGYLREIDIEKIVGMNFNPNDPNNPNISQTKYPFTLRICIAPKGIHTVPDSSIYILHESQRIQR